MAILKVAQIGHAALRAKADAVSQEHLRDPAFQRLLDDLVETMREYDGVGLAAPQVREGVRAFVMEIGPSERYPDRPAFPLLEVVNPVVTPRTAEITEEWEGCLSIAGFRGLVPRPSAVRLEGMDRAGDPIDIELEGFAAVVAQHETDHLDGVVYLDRMPDLTMLMAEEEYRRQIAVPAREAPAADSNERKEAA